MAELDWGRVSYRHVVLIGNASAHTNPDKSGGLTMSAVLTQAQPPGGRLAARKAVTIHALQVPSADPADSEIAHDQFLALSGGHNYSGHYARLDEVGGFVSQLTELLRVKLSQLEQFVATLDVLLIHLRNAGEPGGKDVNRIVQALQGSTVLIAFGETISTETDLAKLFEWVSELPVRNRIFSITPARLAAMGATDYEIWVRNVQASRNLMKAHIENKSLWFSLTGKPLGGDTEAGQKDHGFLKVTALP